VKKIAVFFVYFNVLSLLIAQTGVQNNFTMPPMSRYFGYYLPFDFVISFEETKNYYMSRDYIKDYEYICIRVDRYGIWVQEPTIGDGNNVRLIHNRNGIHDFRIEYGVNDELIVITNTGERYIKISNDFDYDIPAIDNYIGRIMLNDLIITGEVIISNDIITIPSFNNSKFRIITWNHWGEAGPDLHLDGFDMMWYVYLEINENEYTIYRNITWNTGQVTRRIFWRGTF